ncbi:MAG: hypothetical protein IPK78_18305 [Rhodospirillales bacterium]|nr:hypothetical protein [Rhodospirillales bacterium]
MCCWIYVYSVSGTPGSYRNICNNGNTGPYSAAFSIFLAHEGTLVFAVAAGALDYNVWHTFDSLNPISLNAWHFVSCRHDPAADVLKANIDAAQDSEPWDKGIASPSSDWVIGRHSPTHNLNYMDGRVGPMMVWNRALSDAEISQLYNAGNGLAFPF